MQPFQAELLDAILPSLAHDTPRTREMAKFANQALMRLVEGQDELETGTVEVGAGFVRTIETLQVLLASDAVETRMAALRWLHLYRVKKPAMV